MNPSISDAAVCDATGREWKEWFGLLAGTESAAAEAQGGQGPELDHKALVAWLKSEYPGLSGWWRQMITNEYEKHTGRRVTGQTLDAGFQVGVQKTLAASADDLWSRLTGSGGVASWLGDDVSLVLEEGASYGAGDGPSGEVRVVVPGDRLRLTWQPGAWPRPSTLQVRLTGKGDGRTVVSLHHEHLPDRSTRDAMRVRWREVLADLAERAGS
jgi:uncharacterized protein YndB with AHSA1/START domain